MEYIEHELVDLVIMGSVELSKVRTASLKRAFLPLPCMPALPRRAAFRDPLLPLLHVAPHARFVCENLQLTRRLHYSYAQNWPAEDRLPMSGSRVLRLGDPHLTSTAVTPLGPCTHRRLKRASWARFAAA